MRESVSMTELRDSIAAKKDRLHFSNGTGRKPLPSDENYRQLVFVSHSVARIQAQQGCQCRLAINQDGVCFLECRVVSPIWSAVDGRKKVRHPVISVKIRSSINRDQSSRESPHDVPAPVKRVE